MISMRIEVKLIRWNLPFDKVQNGVKKNLPTFSAPQTFTKSGNDKLIKPRNDKLMRYNIY